MHPATLGSGPGVRRDRLGVPPRRRGARTTPSRAAANRRLAHAGIDEEARLAHEADGPARRPWTRPWHAATVGSTYNLRITAVELAELGDRLDALIRPYIALTREDAPPDAQPVHVSLRAYRRPLP